MKRISLKKVTAIVIFVVVFLIGAFIAPTKANAASSWTRTTNNISQNIKRHTQQKFESTVKKTVNRGIDRMFNLLDPNSKEYKTFSAKRFLDSLPYGESVVLVTGTKASTLRRVIKESPLFDYVGPAKSQYGKTVGIRVYRYSSIDEMLGYDY